MLKLGEAIQKLEDEKPLAGPKEKPPEHPTGASSEAPSGVLTWEALSHYNEKGGQATGGGGSQDLQG